MTLKVIQNDTLHDAYYIVAIRYIFVPCDWQNKSNRAIRWIEMLIHPMLWNFSGWPSCVKAVTLSWCWSVHAGNAVSWFSLMFLFLSAQRIVVLFLNNETDDKHVASILVVWLCCMGFVTPMLFKKKQDSTLHKIAHQVDGIKNISGFYRIFIYFF